MPFRSPPPTPYAASPPPSGTAGKRDRKRLPHNDAEQLPCRVGNRLPMITEPGTGRPWRRRDERREPKIRTSAPRPKDLPARTSFDSWAGIQLARTAALQDSTPRHPRTRPRPPPRPQLASAGVEQRRPDDRGPYCRQVEEPMAPGVRDDGMVPESASRRIPLAGRPG